MRKYREDILDIFNTFFCKKRVGSVGKLGSKEKMVCSSRNSQDKEGGVDLVERSGI